MKKVKKPTGKDIRVKMAMVIALFSGAGLITASGLLFTVYSVSQNLRLGIFGANIPGVLVALLMTFFGIRSFIMVRKLKNNILSDKPQLS